MNTLYLYTTLGCHLCELAKDQLNPLLIPYDIQLVEVEIADDELLLEAYGVRIPVIKLQNAENELGWPFDTEMAHDFLSDLLT